MSLISAGSISLDSTFNVYWRRLYSRIGTVDSKAFVSVPGINTLTGGGFQRHLSAVQRRSPFPQDMYTTFPISGGGRVVGGGLGDQY
jgi:hypothetical protein